MSNHPEIINRKRLEVSKSNTSFKLKDVPAASPSSESDEQNISSEALPLEIIRATKSPERREAVDQLLPTSLTYSEWQQELREIAWEYEQDVWEDVAYD